MSNNSKEGIQWYTLDNILKHQSQFYIIFGERSNGKSFAVDRYILDKYFEHGEQFAFVKRYEEDIKIKYMSCVFPDELLEYVEERYNKKIKFYQGKWLCYDSDKEGKISECDVMGIAFSLSNVNRTKATTYPKVTTILFEEFMSIDCTYIPDELSLFLNLISTIVRYRHNVKVFMLANAISKHSPYSQALGIRLHRLKKGEIIDKEFTDSKGFKTKFTIERTLNVNVFDNKANEDKIVYNIFGNAGVGKMITSGDFETHAYKRECEGVSFKETGKGDIHFNKKDLLPIMLRFEDYFYKIYLKHRGKFILGFRELDEGETINVKKTKYIINGLVYMDGIVNIYNVVTFQDDNINDLLNIIVNCMRQKDFVSLTDDDGENIVNGFRIGGLNLIN